MKSKHIASVVFGVLMFGPLSAGARTFETLYSFTDGTSDGAYPFAALLDVNGTLYGTAEEGGKYNAGTVFKIDPLSGALKVLHSFSMGADSQNPIGALVDVGGTLYGTTSGYMSQPLNGGTLFSVDPTSGAETVLHNFNGGADGFKPFGAVVDVRGKLYGTTSLGGNANCGTVFKFDLANSAEAVLHPLNNEDGADPQAGLLSVGDMLYGAADGGGKFNYGTIFQANSKSGALTDILSFKDSKNDGAGPDSVLIAVGGKLYGTTTNGGSSDIGTVFSIGPSTGAVTILHSFAGGADGEDPWAGLLRVGKELYGTTVGGGPNGGGTIFKINIASGVEEVVYSFSGGDGEYPHGELIKVGDVFYGTTYFGGLYNYGTVFSFTP